jgi:predicted small metal-binding protein
MKRFACGDVVPGCDARFVCSTEDEVLVQVAAHAAEVHGMVVVPSSVVTSIKAAMVTV